MAAYITEQELIDRFGEGELIAVTNRTDPAAATIDPDVLDAAIRDAQDEVDGYLAAGGIAVPLGYPIPPRVARVVSDLTRWHLYDDQATEEVRRRYEDARAWLRDVASGRVALVGESVTASTSRPVAPGWTVTAHTTPASVFTPHG
jgi:phage gp36-like protein